MKRVKACLNSECSECKKTYYKATDEFCVKCGSKLSYVCKHKNCFKALPDDSKEILCPVHDNSVITPKRVACGGYAVVTAFIFAPYNARVGMTITAERICEGLLSFRLHFGNDKVFV